MSISANTYPNIKTLSSLGSILEKIQQPKNSEKKDEIIIKSNNLYIIVIERLYITVIDNANINNYQDVLNLINFLENYNDGVNHTNLFKICKEIYLFFSGCGCSLMQNKRGI